MTTNMKTYITTLFITLLCLSGCSKQPTQANCQLYGMEAQLDAISLSMGNTAAERMADIDGNKLGADDKKLSKRVLQMVVEDRATEDQVFMACMAGKL